MQQESGKAIDKNVFYDNGNDCLFAECLLNIDRQKEKMQGFEKRIREIIQTLLIKILLIGILNKQCIFTIFTIYILNILK